MAEALLSAFPKDDSSSGDKLRLINLNLPGFDGNKSIPKASAIYMISIDIQGNSIEYDCGFSSSNRFAYPGDTISGKLIHVVYSDMNPRDYGTYSFKFNSDGETISYDNRFTGYCVTFLIILA